MIDTRSRLLERVSAPASEPVSLSDTKAFLRVEHSDDDTLIGALIAAAHRAAEQYLRRSLITQSWLLAYDDYPPCQTLLPLGPVQSITSVTLVAENGGTTSFASVNYALDAAKRRLVFSSTPLAYRIEIRYQAGYGNADDVPESITQGILHHVAALYDARQGSAPIPPAATELYRPYREVRI